MLIDVHAHWGPWFFSMDVASIDVNIDLMDRFGIDLQLVSAIEGIVYDAPAGNRALAAQLPADPRLRGMVVVDPRRLGEARADLEELLAGDGRSRWVGAKIHTEYSRTPVTSPRMQAAIELATEYGLPTLVHTWNDSVVDLADVVARIPDAQVIAGHMGAGGWPRVPEAADRTDRLWFEPCWSAPDANRIRWVLDQIGPSHMLFGTDATLIDPSVALGAFEAANLTPEEHQSIMWQNATTLFTLPTN
jgi:predicted TIM-barrel fold metal-dependent hydrolase